MSSIVHWCVQLFDTMEHSLWFLFFFKDYIHIHVEGGTWPEYSVLPSLTNWDSNFMRGMGICIGTMLP